MDFNSKYLHHLNQKLEGNRLLNSPSKFKQTNSLILVRQTPTSNVSTGVDRTLRLSYDQSTRKNLSTTKRISWTPSKHQSLSLYGLNRPILKSKFHPKYYSYRSLIDNKENKGPIWEKRYKSHSTIEQLLNR
jgi:hypothetical protein